MRLCFSVDLDNVWLQEADEEEDVIPETGSRSGTLMKESSNYVSVFSIIFVHNKYSSLQLRSLQISSAYYFTDHFANRQKW